MDPRGSGWLWALMAQALPDALLADAAAAERRKLRTLRARCRLARWRWMVEQARERLDRESEGCWR